MPSSSNLDTILIVATAIVLSADIIIALSISIILPKYVTERERYKYRRDKYDRTAMMKACQCWRYHRHSTHDDWGDVTEFTITYHPNRTSHKANGSMVYRTRMQPRRPPRSIDQNGNLQKNNENTLESNPYLVLLSRPAYSDAMDSWIFACTGIILNQELVLAGANCVTDRSEFLNLLVRSGSPFWSEFGTVHGVTEVLPTPVNDLVALRITPQFVWGPLVKPVNISERPGQWTFAKSAELIDKKMSHSSKEAIQGRLKNTRLEMTSYTTTECFPSRIYHICQNLNSSYSDCRANRITSSPLVSSCGELIGFKVENCDLFLDVFSVKLRSFISDLNAKRESRIYLKEGQDTCIPLYENRCNWESQDVCQSVVRLNSSD